MNLRRILAVFICVCMLMPVISGCGETGKRGGASTGTLPDDADSITHVGYASIIQVGYDPLPCPEEEICEQLFDLNNRIQVDIDMPEAELRKLQKDYESYRAKGSKSPIYRMATVTITITTEEGSIAYRIPEVGLRMKGNTSRTDFYSDGEGIYNYIHFKLDFQETFDDETYYGTDSKVWESDDLRKERKNRTFATLEKLELRWNKCYDSTYLKETYAYELYRSEGVLAPRTNLSSLGWSGVHMGIYTVLEPVDEVFLEKRLSEEELGGDLYKCGWSNEGAAFTSLNSIGIENEDTGEFYAYDLKSNKKTSEHETLRNLITHLNSGEVTAESFAKLVDTENFLSFAAVSYFLGNPDDLRNNYNNFYLYFLKSSDKALFIPYDYDRCLGVTYEWDPTGNGVTKDDPFADTMAADSKAGQKNPLFLYSVVKGGYYVEEYANTLRRVAGNPLLKPETFEGYFDRARNLYEDDLRPSKTLRNAEGRQFSFANQDGIAGNLSFGTYITEKMATYERCMNNLDSYLNYERPEQMNYYIRADFTNWEMWQEYGRSPEDGLLTWTLQFDHEFRFKVYNDLNQGWYGVESFPESQEPPYTTDSHGNIVLQAGTYLVTFDPMMQTLTVEKQ